LINGYGWGNLGGGDNGPSQIRPWWYTRLGYDPRDPNSGGDSGFSQLDFGLFSTFRDNLSRGSFEGVARVLKMDRIYGNATELVTFLQNHDVGLDNEFRFRFKGEQWMAQRPTTCSGRYAASPAFYFGEEIEFMKGVPQDIIGNDDTLETTGRVYFGDHIDDGPPPPPGTTPYTSTSNASTGSAVPSPPYAMQGPVSHIAEWGSGISFVCDWNQGESYMVVELAIGGGQDIRVDGVGDGLYRDAVIGSEVSVQDGNLAFYVKGSSAGIYVLDGPGKIGKDGLYLR